MSVGSQPDQMLSCDLVSLMHSYAGAILFIRLWLRGGCVLLEHICCIHANQYRGNTVRIHALMYFACYRCVHMGICRCLMCVYSCIWISCARVYTDDHVTFDLFTPANTFMPLWACLYAFAHTSAGGVMPCVSTSGILRIMASVCMRVGSCVSVRVSTCPHVYKYVCVFVSAYHVSLYVC